MGKGDPGKEQFRRAFTQMRNTHIAAGLTPLILLRQELLGNDEFSDRGGSDDPTRDHFLKLLLNCDVWRRRLTHNPDHADLGDKIAKAVSTKEVIDEGENPFGGDDIQNQSGGLFALPYKLDGSNEDIPLNSKIKLQSGNANILLGAVDRAIVTWTRLQSKDRTSFITQQDSMRIYGCYQAILSYIKTFLGDKNRIDVAQVLPSQEPLGAADSPNRVTEAVNKTS